MFSLSDILPIYKVWKFSVEKYSSYGSTKKVWMDRQMDRQTPDDPYSNLTKILPRQTFWWSLKVLCRKVFQFSQHKESMDGQIDGWTNRPQMTHIRTWPRSYPDTHSDQIWKFSVEKYSSYRSTKKVWTDGPTDVWTDRQTMWLL